ncbi:biotin--[acetyl-CoA-carboxylase] ligase [Bacteroides pyogenes]|jgi:BirA family biotin operon repressor/biotin-[acetyl-CoA-carboxylase] ligase|uniref:Biotin--[acetyl-CoA-carboxylase] ligase n=1 Tax=Bacteroides pyogenes TaxID=310300 RepID=A0A5D3F1W2_9BACE|nr:biotin--[acetyl-CoA-carboxylase] ligase [Bacteroides pyogenes]MCI7071039.1 biotin--[acetyl-CoA-carboxylase] ligase [Bacteroides pyogenes]MDY5352594.1 biotin--[acetyl-CoA-carboxylase] ligase [Bacteroides pyogenes]TYK32558.1 biotin--[acetyl-CoA-carboxylase] ligase [Bacteroides pyogenes]TYK41385.1 biotin--[acetyl-CoA-carboxylase] ligase [Bacteroides pyogenes]TYK45622.1 biotin--[acetyl-CoA-carboxylase] ligase [Bacteroides pyogenes]
MIPFFELFPMPLIHLHKTHSTNTWLRELCQRQNVEAWTTVLADFQTSGRGQRGNSWESADSKNLLFSFVIFPDFLEASRQFLISQIISLGIKEELDTYTENISIKWPNDIYWKNKKIAGILIEHDLMGEKLCRSIAGIGININQEIFYSSAPNPVSLFQITGKQYETVGILKNILLRIQSYYNDLCMNSTDSIEACYKESLFRKEGLHPYKDVNGEFFARIVNVEPQGKLILEDENLKMREYMFKEVEYLSI